MPAETIWDISYLKEEEASEKWREKRTSWRRPGTMDILVWDQLKI